MSSLVTCRVCGKKVSINSYRCNGCGEPNFYHSKTGIDGGWELIFFLGKAIVGLILLIYIISKIFG